MGIVSHNHCYLWTFYLIITGSIIVGSYCYIKGKKRSFYVGLLLSCYAVGGINTILLQERYEQFFTKTQDTRYRLDLYIDDVTQIDNTRYPYQIKAHITKYTTNTLLNTPIPPLPCYDVVWYTSTAPDFCPGETIGIENHIFKKPKNADFALFMCKERVVTTLFGPQSYQIITKNRPQNMLLFVKNKIHATSKRLLSDRALNLFASLFLGEKTGSSSYDTKTTFRAWGLSHYLARSGLHLICVIALLNNIIRIVPFGYIGKQIIVALLCLIYYATTGSSISFIRALCMFLASTLCLCITRRPRAEHITILVALGILMYNPLHLYYLDFQLSFLLTYAVLWIHANTSKRMN